MKHVLRYSLIGAVLLVPFFLKAQKIDSFAYYNALNTKQVKTLKALCKEARNNRHGVMAIYIDSNYRPLAGIKLSLDSSSWSDTAGSDLKVTTVSLETGITDLNGGCIFKHNKYNVDASAGIDTIGHWNNRNFWGYADDRDYDMVHYRLSAKDQKDDDAFVRWEFDHDASNVSNIHNPACIVKKRVLKDSATKTKFILDKDQIYVTAVDSNGKQLWKTDPWKDNKVMVYRIKRPIIITFTLTKDPAWTKNVEVIWIGYDNSQFGALDKQTGKFTFYGQE